VSRVDPGFHQTDAHQVGRAPLRRLRTISDNGMLGVRLPRTIDVSLMTRGITALLVTIRRPGTGATT
jgi:hypothetical protein